MTTWKRVKREPTEQKERNEIWKLQLNPGIKHPKMTWGETEASIWTIVNTSCWNIAGKFPCCFHLGSCAFLQHPFCQYRGMHTQSYCITNVVICSREMRRLQLVPTLLHIKAVVCNQGNLVGTVFRSLFYTLDSGVKIVLSNLVMYMLKERRCCYL